MNVKLLRYQDDFYLCYGKNTTKRLDIRGVKHFLKHYYDEDYYIEEESCSIEQTDSVQCYELMAFVNEKMQLCICNPELMQIVLFSNVLPYITTDEFAKKHNRKKAIVLRLCREGRIEGAVQANSVWLIPEDAPYPADARYGARVPSSRVLIQKPENI